MAENSDALVVFGATGDLAYKQIFPALHSLIRRGQLDIPIIGMARSGWNLERLKQRVRESIEQQGDVDPRALNRLCELLRYVDGDYREPDTYQRLGQALSDAERPLHYLAIPPSMFETVIEGLSKCGCTSEARVVVEKPFGRDLESARSLNRTLQRFFPESAILR